MKSLLHYSLLLLIPSVILVHLLYAPYTKVEESFNIQAIHDILSHGIPLQDVGNRITENYDHMTFSGVVPRTFVGALAVSGFAKPFVSLVANGEQLQILVRGILGLINALSLIAFEDAISQAFGNVAGIWYILLQCSQFHVIYYASRTLPNMYAFALTTLSLRSLILSSFGPRPKRARQTRIFLTLTTTAGVIFRSELALLLATHSAFLLLFRRVSLQHILFPAGISAALFALFLTITIDSFFWQTPLWPEWTAFRFNTLEGHSSEWGTSPSYFYFLNALPKLLINPSTYLLCIPIALADRYARTQSIGLVAPNLAFITLYSLLPHKEWRFILYSVPPLTGVAAAGAAYIWVRRSRSWLFSLLALALVASTFVSFIASTGLLAISSMNYPGAAALGRLHDLAHGERPMIRVHLGNLACQTGVTRFLQKPAPVEVGMNGTVWHYDKSEIVGTPDDEARAFWERFGYVLVEREDEVVGRWEIVEVVSGYAGVGLVKGQTQSGNGNGNVSKNEWIKTMMVGYRLMEDVLRRYVTGGRWIEVKMEPKIRIMRKLD